jgi:hypothetical protein
MIKNILGMKSIYFFFSGALIFTSAYTSMSVHTTRTSGILHRARITGLSMIEIILSKLIGSLYLIALGTFSTFIFFGLITDMSYNGSIFLGLYFGSQILTIGLLQGLIFGIIFVESKYAFIFIQMFTLAQVYSGNMIW